MNVFSTMWSTRAITLLAVICVSAFAAFGQDKDWRPVSPDDLQSKTPKVESDADAEALFWEVRIDDSSSDDVSRRHYVRVKIYTERGREKFSKFDIPFTKNTKIKDLAARVIKADGSIVEIAKADIFEREIVRASGIKIKAKSFAIPNIEPGVIVEYRYKETTEDAGATGMKLQFQRDIPVQNLSYYYKPYRGEPRFQTYNFTDTKFEKDKDGFYLARRLNVPALKSEPRMPPDETVRPWMLLTGTRIAAANISAFSISYTVKDPSSPVLYWGGVSTEWIEVVKLMLKGSDDVKKATATVTAGANTPEEKLRKIYEFCQTQIANTTYDASLTSDQRAKLQPIKSLNDVLKRKQSNAMFIDLLFGSMASAAGFNARVALMGDRSEMLFHPTMTNDSFIHPGGIAVQFGNDWKIFNPGSKYSPYGMLVWYEEGGWAMLVGEKDYKWIQTPFTSHDQSNKTRTGRFNLLEDGTLEGDVTLQYAGHAALTYRNDKFDDAAATRETNFKDEITAQISTAEVSNISIENFEDSTKPLIFRYKVRVPNYAQKTGKRIFVQPGFFEYGKTAVFSGADRKFDIVFSYPWSETDNIDLTWPKGYELDSADVPNEVSDQSKVSSLKIQAGVNNATRLLEYRRKFHFGGGGMVLFSSQTYPVLKTLFDQIHTANSHTVTLKQL